jgi:hypothetical protein
MKKLFFLCAFSLTVCLLHAQTPLVTPYNSTTTFTIKKFGVPVDTTLYKELYQLRQSQNPVDNMPVVGLQPVQLTYTGNNGSGLDIYKAQQDNMPVVKPDSTFYSGMPVGSTYQILSTPGDSKIVYSITTVTFSR